MKLMFAKTDINWDIKNNQIILSSKGAAKTGAKITVQGNVTDESGEPLPGVTVVAKTIRPSSPQPTSTAGMN